MITRFALAGLGVVLAAGHTAPAATAAQAPTERRAAYQPTLKASKTTVVTGQKLVLSGRVKPAVKGGTVVLQKRIEGRKWAVEKRLTMTKAGKFRYVDKPSTPGLRSYRVMVPKAGKVKAGTSKPVKVTVLRWVPLTQLAVRAIDGTRAGTTVSIGGKQYANSVVSNAGAAKGTIDWNLDPSCTTLRTRFGAGDDGDADATAHVTLTGDSEQLFSGQFMLTQSESRTFDVSDVFRLAFAWSSTKAGVLEPRAGAIATMAGPELLCAI